MRFREEGVSARAARSASRREALGLSCAAQGEAEGQAHVRSAGEAVQGVLFQGGEAEGDHRNQSVDAPGESPGQCYLPDRLFQFQRPGQAAGQAQPFLDKRPEGQHPFLSSEARRRRRSKGKEPQGSADYRGHGDGREEGYSQLDRDGQGEFQGDLQGIAQSGRPYDAHPGTADRRAVLEVGCVRPDRRGRVFCFFIIHV